MVLGFQPLNFPATGGLIVWMSRLDRLKMKIVWLHVDKINVYIYIYINTVYKAISHWFLSDIPYNPCMVDVPTFG